MFWFAVGTTLAAFVLNRKETGKFIAIGQDWTEEQYAAYVKPSLERARGIRDPLMMCTKEGDGTFKFTPFTLHTKGAVKPRKFTVQVKSKRPDMRLAELEFGDWRNNPDLSIAITEIEIPDTADRSVSEDTEAYNRVLTGLKGLPLFLNTETHSPKQKISEIKGHVDFPFGLHKVIGGEWTGHYFVDPEKGQLPAHYQKEAFFGQVLFAAVEGGNDTIINGYFEEIDTGLESELSIVETRRKAEQRIVDDMAKTAGAFRRKLMVTFGVLGLTLGLVGLGIGLMFIPGAQVLPVIGVVITILVGLGTIAMNIMGAASQWQGIFGVLAVAGVVVGIKKTISSHRAYRVKLREDKLKKLNKLSESYAEIRAVLKVQKKELAAILNAIRKNTGDTLDLSGQVVRDNGVKMIRMAFFITPTKRGSASLATTCTTLNLSNSGITGNSVKDLDKILRLSTRLTTIDLSKNKLGVDGLGQLHDGLITNFTVTTLQYDIEGVPQDLQDKITFQLNINRYLHGEKLIGQGVDEAKIRKKALIKLKQNAMVTEVFGTIRKDLQDEVNIVLKQNHFFAQMRVRSLMITPKVFLDAYRSDPRRIELFATSGYWKLIRSKVFPGTSGQRRNLLELQRLALPIRKRLLKQLIPFRRGDKEIDHKVALLADLIEIKTHLPSDDKMGKGQAAEFKLLVLEIIGMLDTLASRTLEQSKAELEKRRLALSRVEVVDEEMLRSKREILSLLQTALNPTLVENAVMRRQKKVLNIVNVRPTTADNLAYFVSIYSQDKASDLPGYFSEEMSRDKLLKLVRMDMVGLDQQDGGGCTQLKLLDEPHRILLLEYCFGDEENARQKAILVSSLIGMSKLFNAELSQDSDIKTLRSKLKSAFNKKRVFFGSPTSFSDLKSVLADLRKQVKKRRSTLTLDEIDQPLQAVLQDDLKKKYPFLAGGDVVVNEELYSLFQKERRSHFELRAYTFPEGLNPKVKGELNYIMARNRWYDALMDRSPTEKAAIDLFFEMGAKMPVDQFQQALEEMKQQDKVVLLVKNDISFDLGCKKLKALDQQRRELLLRYCFGAEKDARDKALLASTLIGEELLFSVKGDQYILSKRQEVRTALSWVLKQGYRSAYDYDGIKKQLDKIREELKKAEKGGENDFSADIKMLDRSIQSVLTARLKTKYGCLRGEELNEVQLDQELTRLEQELSENFELRQYMGSWEGMDASAKKIVELAIKRNQLRDLTTGYMVSRGTANRFIALYEAMDSEEECEVSLSGIGRVNEMRDLVRKDLYDDAKKITTCEKLRGLDSAHRIALLEHCFGEEANAKSKAILASGVMSSGKLFEHAKTSPSDQLVKDLLGSSNYLVYIFPWKRSAYDYDGLKKGLDWVKKELEKGSSGRYKKTPEGVRTEVLSKLIDALACADTESLRQKSSVSSKRRFVGFFRSKQKAVLKKRVPVAKVERERTSIGRG